MRAALVLLAALAGLAACAPRPEPSPPLQFDCTLGFEPLSKLIAGQSGVSLTRQAGEPYAYYRPTDGGPTYVVTDPGAPGHPAVFKQEAVRVDGRKAMMTTGCPYGDRKGYAEVLAYLQGLSR